MSTPLFDLHLENASLIVPAPVSWLWQGRIPLGMLTLLVGPAGRGKSTLSLELGARVTRGQLGHTPANVIVATSEDSLAHTAVPRLIAAGADLKRIDFATIRDEGSTRGLSLPEDLADLQGAIEVTAARLVILDPVVGHISGTIDSHKDHQVRRALGPLHTLAEDTGAAILGIGHLNKAPGSDVLHRLGGSVGFGAAARSVLLFADDPDNEESPERLLAHAKCNVAPHAPTLRYQVESRTISYAGEEIATSGLARIGEDARGAGDLLLVRDRDSDRSERDIARAVILDALADADQRWTDLVELVKDEGASEITARRARDTLKSEGLIRAQKTLHGWWWTLQTNLLTPPEQVDGEQVENPPLTRGNDSPDGQLAHPLETEQVEFPDPFQGAP